MSSELKQCKFCGAERGLYVLWEEDTPYVFCDNCKTSVSNERSNTEEDAIDAWNQRAERTCKFTANKHDNGVCSNCGFEAGMYDGWDPFALEYTNKRCPECGAKVTGD